MLVNADELEDGIPSFEFNIKIQLEEIFKEKEDNPPGQCRICSNSVTDWSLSENPPKRYRFLEDEETAPPAWRTLDDDNIGRLRDLSDIFELAVLEETLAEIIGVGPKGHPLSPDDQQVMCGNVEPIGLAIADRANAWERAFSISQREFQVGDWHDSLWTERFSRLAEFSEQIVIIDGYATSENHITGLLRLLDLINRDGKHCHVKLFSFPDGKQ